MVFLSSWSLKAIQRVEKKIVLLRVHSGTKKRRGRLRLIHELTVVAMLNSTNSFSQLLLKLDDRYLLFFVRTRKYTENLHSGPLSFNAKYWRFFLWMIFQLQYMQCSWSTSAVCKYKCCIRSLKLERIYNNYATLALVCETLYSLSKSCFLNCICGKNHLTIISYNYLKVCLTKCHCLLSNLCSWNWFYVAGYYNRYKWLDNIVYINRLLKSWELWQISLEIDCWMNV